MTTLHSNKPGCDRGARRGSTKCCTAISLRTVRDYEDPTASLPIDPCRHCRPTAPRCAGPHGPWHGFRENAQHVPGRLAVRYYKQRTGVPGTVTIIEGTVIAAQAGGVQYWYVER